MADKPRLLVLCVDLDGDLPQKAGVKGPVVGREANLAAAGKLALADPSDTDANTMFEAVRQRDILASKYSVEVATLTGNPRLGYEADREVVNQLESVISKTGVERCVFVSDGAFDEQILPVVQSRLQIDAVQRVVVKQSPELEKTYVVILDKLKDPHIARIVFGIPGLALVLYFWIGDLGLRVFVGLLGGYLLLKGFGVEERLLRGLSRVDLSFERVSFIFAFAAAPLALVSLWLGASRVLSLQAAGVEAVDKLAAWFLKDVLLLLPLALLLVVVGRGIEAFNEKRSYELPSAGISAAAILLLWLVLNNLANWVIGFVTFADFFLTLVLAIAAMILSVYLAVEFKKSVVAKLPLVGKEVYSPFGGLIGRITAIRKKGDGFEVKTVGGQKIDFSLQNIASLGEKIIVKY